LVYIRQFVPAYDQCHKTMSLYAHTHEGERKYRFGHRIVHCWRQSWSLQTKSIIQREDKMAAKDRASGHTGHCNYHNEALTHIIWPQQFSWHQLRWHLAGWQQAGILRTYSAVRSPKMRLFMHKSFWDETYIPMGSIGNSQNQYILDTKCI